MLLKNLSSITSVEDATPVQDESHNPQYPVFQASTQPQMLISHAPSNRTLRDLKPLRAE